MSAGFIETKSPRFQDLARSAEDGITDIVPTPIDNGNTDILADRYGRLWTRLHLGNAPVSGLNPLPVTLSGISPVDLSVDFGTTPVVQSIVKASPGEIYRFNFSNASGALTYIQFFNQVGALVGGEAPRMMWPLVTDGTLFVDYQSEGIDYTTGIVWGSSTTPNTFTAGMAVWREVLYL